MTELRFSFDVLVTGLAPLRMLGPHVDVARISTDTRSLNPGDGFVALNGERFNGHDYLRQAIAAGAVAVVISEAERAEALAAEFAQVAIFVVADTLAALGRLAAHWRQLIAPRVLGITGSNGKTTTKEIAAAICATQKMTLKTEGNFNNLIGLPLTLLNLDDHELAVIEMGMNQPGEIDRLAEIAAPNVGVITTVNAAHLELLGSIDAVAEAKGELFARLDANATAVVNLDNPYTVALAKRLLAPRGIRQLTVSLNDPAADVHTTRSEATPQGYALDVMIAGQPLACVLPLLGKHNILNALCAIAACYAIGIAPEQMPAGIAQVTLPGRRLKLHTFGPLRILDDCYNANPASMKAGLDLLAEIAGNGRAVAVLGDMLELGPGSADFHRALGKQVAEHGVAILAAFGDFARDVAERAQAAGCADTCAFGKNDVDALFDWLDTRLHSGDTVLVKASRGMRLERVVDHLEPLGKEMG